METTIQSIQTNNLIPQADELKEYICPEKLEEQYSYVETQLCEDLGLGKGCKHIKTCPAYRQQKDFEKENPQANWKLAINKTKAGYKEVYQKLLMIKKGTLMLPKNQNTTNANE